MPSIGEAANVAGSVVRLTGAAGTVNTAGTIGAQPTLGNTNNLQTLVPTGIPSRGAAAAALGPSPALDTTTTVLNLVGNIVQIISNLINTPATASASAETKAPEAKATESKAPEVKAPEAPPAILTELKGNALKLPGLDVTPGDLVTIAEANGVKENKLGLFKPEGLTKNDIKSALSKTQDTATVDALKKLDQSFNQLDGKKDGTINLQDIEALAKKIPAKAREEIATKGASLLKDGFGITQ